MSPTIKRSDVLYVSSYRGHKVRPGDVVVFKSAGQPQPVVHRVLSHDDFGIRTIGDNNDKVDADYLNPSGVIGKVVFLQRGSRLKRVHGGLLGSLVGRVIRIRHLLDYRLSRIAHPAYEWLIRYRIPIRWRVCSIRAKVVCYSGNATENMQLHWRGRIIGWFIPETGTWVIKRPFRLFVDTSVLPVANRDSNELEGISSRT